jgi:4-amino-4-deoxy-L-arabinose transferase-like glycosyltransferase
VPPVQTPSLRTRAALLGILLLALVLRVWTIENGIPHTVGVDEPEILKRAVGMMKSGDFNPHFFDYGGLTIYFHMAVASIRFAVGAMSAEPGFASLDTVWTGDFLLWARMVTALIGTLLVYVVFRAGLRWGTTVALVAAFVTAIHPNLTREAHLALTDTPLTFFVALTLLLSMIASSEERLRWFVAAGIAAGLATAVKYNGALALLMPLATAATAVAVRRRAVAALTVTVAAIVAFLVAAPYSFIDLPHFLNAFAHLASSYNQPRPASVIVEEYYKHLRNSFGFGLPWSHTLGNGALLVALLGMAIMVLDIRVRERRHAALAVVLFTLAYMRLLSHQSLVYARYYLPILPMVALAIGVAVAWLLDHAGRRPSPVVRRVVVAVLVLLALPPLVNATKWNWDRRRTSTEELTARWLERNVAPGDLIKAETAAFVLPPGYKLDYLRKLNDHPLEWYREQNTKYLVASEERSASPTASPDEKTRYQQILNGTQVVHVVPRTDDHPGQTLTVLRIP